MASFVFHLLGRLGQRPTILQAANGRQHTSSPRRMGVVWHGLCALLMVPPGAGALLLGGLLGVNFGVPLLDRAGGPGRSRRVALGYRVTARNPKCGAAAMRCRSLL